MLHVARCMLRHMSWLFTACCTKSGACFALRVARCTLFDVCCIFLTAYSMLRCMSFCCAACRGCSLRGACCTLRVAGRLLFAVYCPLHGACCLDVVCCSMRVVRCILPVARCMWRGVCCTLSSGALHVVPCVSSAALLFVGSCLLHVASCPFSCCPPQCPMSRGVRCLSPVPRRISSRCTCCVASRLLHVA